jgi:hypothetical protein
VIMLLVSSGQCLLTDGWDCAQVSLIRQDIGVPSHIQGAADITPTFRKITVGSQKQLLGCGPFR